MNRKFWALTALMLSIGFLLTAATEDAGKTLRQIEKGCDPVIVEWRVSADGRSWDAYRPMQAIAKEKSTLRAVVHVPEAFAGIRIAGSPLHLKMSFISRGLTEVTMRCGQRLLDTFAIDGSNGTERAADRDVLLDRETKAGEYEVTIEFINRGFKPERTGYWPPRSKPLEEEGIYFQLARAEVDFPRDREKIDIVTDWVVSLKTAFGLVNPEFVRYTFTGKPYQIPDRRNVAPAELKRLNRAWDRAVLAFDRSAFLEGRWDQVKKSIDRSLALAVPLKEYARRFKVHLIGNAHIDIAWLWRMAETKMVARNTFATVIDNMSEYPELRYAQSQAVTYDWMEKEFPELFRKIERKVKEGKWEIVGGMWVEPDCNLISGESWVRQFLYGKSYFQKKFGVDVKIGWNPDSFGYNWNMPQILSRCGLDYFITQKIWWNDTTVFPHFVFWWEGVDGSRLLTYFPPLGYTADLKMADVTGGITKYEATTGYKKSLILYGLGDHGGGPNREILDRVRRQQKLPIAPDFIHSRAGDFLKNIRKDLGKNIPVWKDELYLEYHRGTFTTQAETKKNNRLSESLMADTEKAASISYLLNHPYPASELENWWKTILTNQFHDILPGSSITPVYRDAREAQSQAQEGMKKILDRSLQYLAAAVDTRKVAGVPVLVLNTLSWPRSHLVSVELPLAKGAQFRVLDPNGDELPVEVRPNPEEGKLEVLFVAENLPSLGYKVFSLIPGRSSVDRSDIRAEGYLLENRFYRIEVNPRTGNLSSIFDKKNGREFLAKGTEGNVFEVHEDRAENWDAWNIGYTGRKWTLNRADDVELVSLSPVRAVLKIRKSFLGLSKERYSPTEDFPSSFFTQWVTLYHDMDRIDIRTEADWWETHMMLKVAFPLAVQSDQAAYEIPFATIMRTTREESLWEKARFEVPALKWADLSDSSSGLSLLNAGKYGYDIHANVMKLSLLRSPVWPDPMADKGKHDFTYALYSHGGKWNEGETVKRGYELNNRPIAILLDAHEGALPLVFSFFSLQSRGVILDTIKKSEQGDGLIFRFYESLGSAEAMTLSFFREAERIYETNLLESEERELPLKNGRIELDFKKFEIKTLKVFF